MHDGFDGRDGGHTMMMIRGSNQRGQTIHRKFFQRFNGKDVGPRNLSIQAINDK